MKVFRGQFYARSVTVAQAAPSSLLDLTRAFVETNTWGQRLMTRVCSNQLNRERCRLL
jgi:hypothetical protein